MLKFTGERLMPDVEGSDNNTKIYKEHIIRYKFCLNFIRDKKVLDIACGTGYGAKLIAQNGAQEVWGGDISKDSIKLAREHSNENLHFMQMQTSRIPFTDNYFDAIVSLETIEHIKDYQKFIKEIKRVLKSDGRLILSTPNKKAVQQLAIKNPHHFKEFTKQELLELLGRDFKEIKLFGQRKIQKLNLKQKLIKKIYFLYTKIPCFNFLKNLLPDRFKKNIGNEIDGLSDSFEIKEIKEGEEYLYFILIANK